MEYIAYTSNPDNSINILAGSSNPAVFDKILPTGTTYEVHEGETYNAGGKTWLSDTDEGYIGVKAKEEKDKAINALDSTYNHEKTELANYFLEAAINGDTDLQAELKAEIEQLNADYDEKRRELEGE